jgi:IMP dehydrogenase
MIGSLFAGTEESPGETHPVPGGAPTRCIAAWARSARWRAGSRDRYFQAARSRTLKLVPEGIEGRVPYKGALAPNIHQLVGGLRAGMGYLGVATSTSCATRAASSASARPAIARATCTTSS